MGGSRFALCRVKTMQENPKKIAEIMVVHRFAHCRVKTMQENPNPNAEIMVVHRFVCQHAQRNTKKTARNTEMGKHFVLPLAKEQVRTKHTVLIAAKVVFVEFHASMLEKRRFIVSLGVEALCSVLSVRKR